LLGGLWRRKEALVATVTVSTYEEATREQNLDRFVSLDALLNVLVRLLKVNDGLEHEVGEPWSTFISDDLHVGKLAKESDQIENDDALARKLWPPEAGELDRQPGFLLATGRGSLLAARLLQAVADSPEQLQEAVDDLLRRAGECAEKAACDVQMDNAFLDEIRRTIAEMKDGEGA
jgi:hypothetical protein